MERVDQALSHFEYAPGTRQAYRRWILSYIHHLKRNNISVSRYREEVNGFLTSILEEKKMSDASGRQALNALSFLFERVFDVPLDTAARPVKKRNNVQLPGIITPEEAHKLLSVMKGKHQLMAGLIYGAGLRLTECLRLRVHHLDFVRLKIHVYPEGNGKKRTVMLPESLKDSLMEQINTVRKIHDQDLENGWGDVPLPSGNQIAYKGKEKAFVFQYVFPAARTSTDPGNEKMVRRCVCGSGLQKAIATAAERCGILAPVSCRILRHSFAAHLLEQNADIFAVKELMGHADIKTTLVYRQVIDKDQMAVTSPLDRIAKVCTQ